MGGIFTRWSGQGLEIAAAHRDISLLCVSSPLVSDTMDIMHAIAIQGENFLLKNKKKEGKNKKKRHDGFPFLYLENLSSRDLDSRKYYDIFGFHITTSTTEGAWMES